MAKIMIDEKDQERRGSPRVKKLPDRATRQIILCPCHVTKAYGHPASLRTSFAETRMTMTRIALFSLVLLAVIACGNSPDPRNQDTAAPYAEEVGNGEVQRPATKFIEGKDYMLLQRVRLIDPSGFGQPVEAASFLLPKGWKLQGGVQWRVGHPCMNEAVAVRWTGTSPDGSMHMDGFPVRSWQWNDDPTMLQSLQANQQGYGRTCDVMPAYDAGQFIQQQVLAELGNPTVIGMERADQLARSMEEQARKNGAAMQQAGVQNVAFRPTAVKARLRWNDGTEGTLLCSVDQTIFYMQNFMTGGMSGSYQCQSNLRLLVRHAAGKQEEAERIMATAIASSRVNPGWQQAVAQVFNNVAQVERTEAAKRAGIWREAQQYTSDLQRRTWEDGQASRDRINTQWGQVIRGVDEWKDPNGSSIELSAGYNEAWSRPDGTYILSNDPLFDPSVVLQEDWKRMEKR